MNEQERRNARMIDRIRMMINIDGHLRAYTSAVQITVENAVVVLRGQLPSEDLKQQLLPTVRQAGVLARVKNAVQVIAS